MVMLRESKSVGNHTSAYPTTSSVSRDHPVSVLTSSSSNALNTPVAVKTKQQAVVSPFSSSRDMSQKKVNINNVVREFCYSDEPDNPQVSLFFYNILREETMDKVYARKSQSWINKQISQS